LPYVQHLIYNEVVADASECVNEQTIRDFVPEADAEYLIPQLKQHTNGLGFDYAPFARSVYGA